jgi:hypothetical protein
VVPELRAGAARHTVLSTQVGGDVFEDFPEIAKTELLTSDEGTTIRQFKKDLNWNAAYYKLAAESSGQSVRGAFGQFSRMSSAPYFPALPPAILRSTEEILARPGQ